MRLPFESPQAKQVNKEIFACIYYHAMDESCNLTIEREQFIHQHLQSIQEQGGDVSDPVHWERDQTGNHYVHWEFEGEHIQHSSFKGSYVSFEGSPLSEGLFQFDLWNKTPCHGYDWNALRQKVIQHGVRNSLLVAPMPTASTSQILGNYECFEPVSQNFYVRRTLAGEFVVVNKYLMNDLIDLGLWNQDMKDVILHYGGSIAKIENLPSEIKSMYKTVWEIKQKDLIDMAVDRSIYICQSHSLNLFLQKPTFDQLSSMHFYGWKKGLKTGIYYLRTKPVSQAQMFTVDPEKLQSCLTCTA
jgi:ribonucleotide reductase alpha subunit